MRTTSLSLAGILATLVNVLPVAAAEPEPVQVHFTVFALRPIDHVVFRPEVEAPMVPLKFYPTARSPEFSAAAEMPIVFIDSQSDDVVASATIPAPISKALLIFLPKSPPTEKAGSTYQIHVLDDSTLRRRAGGVAFINLSGLNLVGKLGSRAIALGPGLSSTFNIDGSTELLLETQQAGRRFRSYSQSIELTARERALLIICPPYYPGSFEVQGRLLIDEPPEEKVPESKK